MQALCVCPAQQSEGLQSHSHWVAQRLEWLSSRLLHGAAPALGRWHVQPTCPGCSMLLQQLPLQLSCSSQLRVAAAALHGLGWRQQAWLAPSIAATRHASSQMLLQCHDNLLLLQVLRRSGTPKEQAYAKRLEGVSAESVLWHCLEWASGNPSYATRSSGCFQRLQVCLCFSALARPAGSQAPSLAPGHTGAVQCSS